MVSGYAPGRSPPFGRRRWSFAGDIADPPTSDWASLLRSGYGIVRGALVDGIPVSFGERQLYTILGAEARAPSDFYTSSAALMVVQGLADSCEIDREKGVASGRSVDLMLRSQSLDDEGLLATLFKTPALSAKLQTTVADDTTTIFEVDSTTSWTAPGRAYIGRECIDYAALGTSGPDGASFEGCTRGVAGLAHYHQASGLAGYAVIADVPQHWKGRFVVVYEHLVSPEGRYLGDTWCEVGTYCREAWKGYIDEEPQDVVGGKKMRCLPIVRPPQEIGAKLELEAAMAGQGQPLLAFTAADKITIETNTQRASGPNVPRLTSFATLDWWCIGAANDIVTAAGTANLRLTIQGPARFGTQSSQSEIIVSGYQPGAGTPGLTVYASAWFLATGNYNAAGNADTTFITRIPVDLNSATTAWLVLRGQPSEDLDVATIPYSGTGIIETADGSREIVRWDQTRASDLDDQADLVALRIVEREVDGTPRTDPWRWGGKFTVLAGGRGTWSEVALQLLTSSGTGERGSRDTLGFGFGCGYPEEWIDVDTFVAEPMSSQMISAAATDRRSLVDVIGGWLALWSKCLVQRRNDEGRIVLAVVSTIVTDDATAEEIGTDDVLLQGHGTPAVIEAPNTIVCESSGFEIDPFKVVYRDRGRVQAEGRREWKLLTPGVTRDVVRELAPGIVIRLMGQAAVSLQAPPGSDAAELQPGQRVTLTTAHPLVYDWTTGAYSPASVNGIIAGRSSCDWWSGVVELSVLMQGRAGANAFLCPAAPIIRVVSSTVVEVRAGDEDTFVAGDEVRVYEPGNETAVETTATISAIDSGTHYVTLDTAITSAPVLWMSYAGYSAVTADQTELMFVRSDKRWR